MDSDSLAVSGSKPHPEVIDSPAGLPVLSLALSVAGSCHWSQRQVSVRHEVSDSQKPATDSWERSWQSGVSAMCGHADLDPLFSPRFHSCVTRIHKVRILTLRP